MRVYNRSEVLAALDLVRDALGHSEELFRLRKKAEEQPESWQAAQLQDDDPAPEGPPGP